MQCCVPFCNVFDGKQATGENKEISFHRFPSEMHLRAAWLRALGLRDAHLPDCAVVCSQHFLRDDIYETGGFRQIVTGAIPSTVQICMMCLETDCELILLSKYKLEESYEKLTGYPLFDQGNLKPTVCVQCAGSLTKFSTFRERSLRARLLMMELVAKYKFITVQHMKIINTTMPQADPCDPIKVEHSDEVAQTELNETMHRDVETFAVKDEECWVSVSGQLKDEDLTEEITYENSEEDDSDYSIAFSDRLLDAPADDEQVFESQDPLKCESATIITGNKHTIQRLNDHSHPLAESTLNLFAATSVGVRGAPNTSEEIPRIHIGEANTQSSAGNNRTDINIDRLKNCVVKLYDVVKHPRQAAPIRDGPLTGTLEANNLCDRRNVDAAAEDQQYQATAPNAISTCGLKSDSSSAVQSKTDRSTSDDVPIRRNRSIDNSLVVRKLFTCDVCQKSFNRKSYLVQHIKTHRGGKTYSCELCDYTARHKSRIIVHMGTHTDQKSFSCTLCDYKSCTKTGLVSHVRTHTGKKPYSCKLCDYETVEASHLKRHMGTHTGEKPFVCALCDHKTSTKNSLVLHIRTHTGEKPFACELCDYKSYDKTGLVIHVRTHTGEKPYSCTLCDYKSYTKTVLVLHVRTHTGEKPYSCTLCDYKAGQKSTLRIHMRTHTDEKPFSCTLCDYKSKVAIRITRHMRTHTGEKPFLCTLCDHKTATKSSLVLHMRRHTGEKPFSCKLCDYKTATQSCLTRHKRTHTGEKPFACTLCDHKTAIKTKLEVHMRTHTGEKPFACALCDHKTATKCRLVLHMRTHTGEKPFPCTLCDYKASVARSLRIHMRTHTGEKPFSCTLCDYKARHKYMLITHMKTHTSA